MYNVRLLSLYSITIIWSNLLVNTKLYIKLSFPAFHGLSLDMRDTLLNKLHVHYVINNHK